MAPPELTDDQKKLVRRVDGCYQSTKDLHQRHELRWNHYYAQYRAYTDWKRQFFAARGPRDKDVGLSEAKREWGAELFIPYIFATIETQIPRILAHRPRLLVLPADQVAESNVENMKWLVDRQQEQIDIELRFQTVAKDAFLYGIGIGKSYWKTERRTENYLAPAQVTTPDMQQQGIAHTVAQRQMLEFDDPFFEAVDPFDFFWDPWGYDMDTTEWVIHRTWRSTDYVMKRIQAGDWCSPEQGLPPLTVEDVKSMATPGRYDEAWNKRMQAGGLLGSQASSTQTGQRQLHEVWEYHDGRDVTVILDRRMPVLMGKNPAWHGEMPFHIYRPTELPHEMVGMGEVEPVEDLQAEMNTLRSQRRDAATMSLNAPLAYWEGMVDPADMKWGPNQAWPVNGDPRSLIFQIPVKDVPASGYEESKEIQGDIERTSGIADALAGADQPGGTSETATGAQLVLAAANKRIELKTRRLEVELMRPCARQWVRLNQQHIIHSGEQARQLAIPKPPDPSDDSADQRWEWRKLGPNELAGEFDIVPEGGSTAPDNLPQMRQDAQMMASMLGNNPHIDQRMLLRMLLEKLSVRNPESLMVPPDGVLPQSVLQKLQQMGVAPNLIQAAVEAAQRENPTGSQAPQGAMTPPQPPEQAGAPGGG